jgi:hypothetical protein
LSKISFGICCDAKIFQGLAIAVSIPALFTKNSSMPGSLAVPPDKIICLIGNSSLYFWE